MNTEIRVSSCGTEFRFICTSFYNRDGFLFVEYSQTILGIFKEFSSVINYGSTNEEPQIVIDDGEL